MITPELDLLEQFLEKEGKGFSPELQTSQYYFIPKLKADIKEGRICQPHIKEYFVKGIQPQQTTISPEEGLFFELNIQIMKSSLKTRETQTKNTSESGQSTFKHYDEQNILKRVTFNIPERQNKFNRRGHLY